MPAVGDIITGIVTYGGSATIRAVGPIKTVAGSRFFAQLRSPLNGASYNGYFNLSDEFVTWVHGDQSSERINPSSQATGRFVVDGVDVGATRLNGYPVLGLPSYHTEAWVNSVGAWFDLGPAVGPAVPLTVVDAGDGRQWVRRLALNQQFLAATFWSVSTQRGSDEAIGWGMTEGEADAHPLRTYHELNRRIFGWNQNGTCAGLTGISLSIHNLDDVNTADVFTILTSIASPSYDKFIRIRGTLNPVDDAAMDHAITDVIHADPIPNTEREIVIAGLGLTPQYVNTIIQTVDGQKTAVVTRQNAAGRFAISQVRDGGSAIDGFNPTNVSDFAVGERVNFLVPTQLGGWPFPLTAVFRLLGQVRLTQNPAAPDLVCYGENGPNYTLITQCLLGAGVPRAFEYGIDGGSLYITSSGIFATHSSTFSAGTAQWNSCAVIPKADGPLLEGPYALVITDEVSFVGPGGPGLRNIGDGLVTVSVENDSSIASFGMTGPTISMLNTHNGIAGEFVGSTVLSSVSRWYGKDNTGFLLVIPKGARCSKFPKAGLTVVTADPYAINIAGRGTGDPNVAHNKNWSDIPIVITDESLTQFADSTTDSV